VRTKTRSEATSITAALRSSLAVIVLTSNSLHQQQQVLTQILEHAPTLEQHGVGAEKVIRVKEVEVTTDYGKWGLILTEWIKGQEDSMIKSVDLNYFYEDTGAPRKVLNQILEVPSERAKRASCSNTRRGNHMSLRTSWRSHYVDLQTL